MTDYPQNSVNMTLAGAIPVRDGVRERMFAAFDAAGLMPDRWLLGDGPATAFTRAERFPWETPGTISFVRERELPYRLVVFAAPKPTVWLRAPAPVSPSDVRRLAELADRLCEVLTPDVAFVNNLVVPPPGSNDDDARLQSVMNLAARATPEKYRNVGPGGLAMRTHFGPFLVAQIGRERLLSLPAPTRVTELAWGGVRIDLVPEPWLASQASLRQAFATTRAHLEPAQFFTRAELAPNGGFRVLPPLEPSPDRDPGGRVR